MWFALGFIAGMVTATFIAAVLTFFKSPIQERIEIVGRLIEAAGPRPTGGIYEPREDEDVAREKIIARNRERGRDTPISELQ